MRANKLMDLVFKFTIEEKNKFKIDDTKKKAQV